MQGDSVSNEQVVKDIISVLSSEFVDYGYLKVTHYLRNEKHYIINPKKVYRLVKELHLLLQTKVKSKYPKQWVTALVPQPESAFIYWEFDIKFIYIHHLGRYAPMLSIIDVYSRYLIGWTLQWSLKKEDVSYFFDAILYDYLFPKKVCVRCDNGSQFESLLLRNYLQSKCIVQEFTRPATPEQNAHIESYHSIIQSAVCSRFEFDSLEHAKEILICWEQFYKLHRIHSGIDYKSPVQFLKEKNITIPIKANIKKSNFAKLNETETSSAAEQMSGIV